MKKAEIILCILLAGSTSALAGPSSPEASERSDWTPVGLNQAAGRFRSESSDKDAARTSNKRYAQFSGIYPHLAMFNEENGGECGIGALVQWADRLWAVTYSPYHHRGSSDKLFRIGPDEQLAVFQRSVGGTPANRMIHPESRQLNIGPYWIDANGKVRVIPPAIIPGRLTGSARHLTEPATKIYIATMEEGFYEVDVQTLKVTPLFADRQAPLPGPPKIDLPGTHGKGLYSGQGRLVYSNNGGDFQTYGNTRTLNKDFANAGVLAEWDGSTWNTIHEAGFLDVSGPGGIRGNPDPARDPLWAIGWDYRSVLLKLLDQGVWHTYRLPKATHTFDGPHGVNTEWPRIGEIGDPNERLIYTHGLFYRMPTHFTATQAHGLRPRSSYLKMVSDSTPWQGRIAFACNDVSDEKQAICLNPRKTKGALTPSLSHANIWFVEPGQLNQLGVPSGRGSVWENDTVTANVPSDAYLFAGFDRRAAHVSHTEAAPVTFTFELDRTGNRKWQHWKSVEVSAGGYAFVGMSEAPAAEWIRVRTDRDAASATVVFHYANMDERATRPAPKFSGLARPEDRQVIGGLIRARRSDRAPLGYVVANATAADSADPAYFEMGSDMRLHALEDANAAAELVKIAAIPTGVISADEASVLYVDCEDGKRYRLPRGRADFAQQGVLGPERVDREVVRERTLFNTHGIFYELPYRNAGGFPLIRPITTHNMRIKDYAGWRGLLVMTGIHPGQEADSNPHIIVSEDGLAAVWAGAIDDLWHLGKAVGVGGPWMHSAVEPGVPSDPYLMRGFDRKELTLAHQSKSDIQIRVEIDITGYGDWHTYKTFTVPPGRKTDYEFPADFNAYWLRTVADTNTIATAQLSYH